MWFTSARLVWARQWCGAGSAPFRFGQRVRRGARKRGVRLCEAAYGVQDEVLVCRDRELTAESSCIDSSSNRQVRTRDGFRPAGFDCNWHLWSLPCESSARGEGNSCFVVGTGRTVGKATDSLTSLTSSSPSLATDLGGLVQCPLPEAEALAVVDILERLYRWRTNSEPVVSEDPALVLRNAASGAEHHVCAGLSSLSVHDDDGALRLSGGSPCSTQ